MGGADIGPEDLPDTVDLCLVSGILDLLSSLSGPRTVVPKSDLMASLSNYNPKNQKEFVSFLTTKRGGSRAIGAQHTK